MIKEDTFSKCTRCHRFTMNLSLIQNQRDYLHIRMHSNDKPGPGHDRALITKKQKNGKILFFQI